MARVKLTYIVGLTENLEALGIDISTARKSIDGTKTIMHTVALSDAEMNSIFVDMLNGYGGYVRYSDENADALMLTPEWATPES